MTFGTFAAGQLGANFVHAIPLSNASLKETVMNRTKQLNQETHDSDAPVELDFSELACVSGGFISLPPIEGESMSKDHKTWP
jgi:hypothetical protein